MQQILVSQMVHMNIDSMELKQLARKAFIHLEDNGRISEKKLMENCKNLKLGLSQVEIQNIINGIAKYEDGIDFREFVTTAIDKRDILTDEKIQDAFNLMDADASGEIDVNELRRFFASRG